ncbi:hypothetical protein ACFX13_025956 [Malus domestica]
MIFPSYFYQTFRQVSVWVHDPRPIPISLRVHNVGRINHVCHDDPYSTSQISQSHGNNGFHGNSGTIDVLFPLTNDSQHILIVVFVLGWKVLDPGIIPSSSKMALKEVATVCGDSL